MLRQMVTSLALLLGLSASAAADPPSTSLTVSLTGFRNVKGQVLVGLYDKADGWLKHDRAVKMLRLPIPGEAMTVAFPSLTPGTYAVSVIHDENLNNKMDMRWLPPGPAEGTAVSRDAKGRLGPPKFNDAKMDLPAGPTEIRLTVRY